ncbi:sensor histidine kinase [Nocardiopsis sp. NPDC050513]|uniref:sensor histidine kinase n=1 Tax=Nocardiopsis sp. NPDC050513 TaxID=3364338 RepID=UPI0037ADC08E
MPWPLAPIGLLLLSQAVAWLPPGLLPHEWLLWSALLTLPLVMVRLALLRYGQSPISEPVLKTGFVLHTVLLLLATALNPYLAIYAFVGYFDARRWFDGGWTIAVMVATSLLSAFGQAGGLAGLWNGPWVVLVLTLVNLAISQTILRLEQAREKEMRRRERVAEELAAAHRGNLRLHQQLLDQARETGVSLERARLSREIHDTVAQGLVAVIRQLQAIPDTELGGVARQRLELAEASAHTCLDEARRAVVALAPRQLRSQGLCDAVREELELWSARTGLRSELVVDGSPGPAAEHDHVVLRVVQESLSNVARHAGDCQVTVSLSWLPEMVMVDVYDDGVGFDHDRLVKAPDGQRHGLAGMAARVAEVAGQWSVESRSGEGCTVSAVVPR